MVDVVNKETRSRMMSGIRSKDTKPEILLRKELHKAGFRFQLSTKVGKIKPDIVLVKYKAAIFTHGCYWHRHPKCKLAYLPKSKIDFWNKKFSDNVDRDKRVLDELLNSGWRVAIVWECVTRNKPEFQHSIELLSDWIRSENVLFETEYYSK